MDATTGTTAGRPRTAALRVESVTNLLSRYVHNRHLNNPSFLFNLCFSLAKCIDHAIANNEVPSNSCGLPLLLKQVYKCKSDFSFVVAFMVLMISVKSACKIGWFPDKDTCYLLTLADEVGRNFSSTEDNNVEPSRALPCISKIMSRFYPKMKIGHILASLEVKPGYKAFMADFHMSRSMVEPAHEKIWLLVARTDSSDTSSCIITPPQGNFLLNGKGVCGRNNVSMDNRPQLPTNVTAMLKYGINLLQAIGHFDGCYIIVIATISMISSSGTPELLDYPQPGASVDSDIDIISARISLNCPIRQCRMRTPVKGHLCKHFQCFDYDNFLEINSKRPSWRCPYCNQSVCYPEIRIDQNVVKVLKEVGGNVVDVIISMDGSWKAVLENNDHSAQRHDETKISQQESSGIIGIPDQSFSTSSSLTHTEFSNRCQNPSAQIKDDLRLVIYPIISSVFCSSAALDTNLSALKVNSISNTPPVDLVGPSALSDVLSLAPHREPASVHGITQPTTTLLQNQPFNPNNLHLQQSAFRSSPSAMQTRPAQAQIPGSCQLRRIPDTFMPGGASPATFQSVASAAPNKVGYDTLTGGTERERLFCRSHMISFPVSDMVSSSPMQQHSPIQQKQQHSNLPSMRMTQAVNLSQNFVHQSIPAPSVQVQQHSGGNQVTGTAQPPAQISRAPPSVPVQLAPSRTGSAFSLDMVTEPLRKTGEQQENVGGATQQISRSDGLAALASEQNWRPSGRMRGSLTGEAYSAAFRQFIFQPTQPAQASQPLPNLSTNPAPLTNQHNQFSDCFANPTKYRKCN
ncbi:E4 SUMO-protein ligase PIAL2-like isoform X2 [Cornus florida]|uniref:E4 SUMO-protein ligase PIAL2-like isoform X2 n=1 Tax=Cornus florida TaxID=4283 RepID=UPI0028A1088C|nr:E4 SUMO-protein ligase PIAL2-like isoform X2 [Cornus florida]